MNTTIRYIKSRKTAFSLIGSVAIALLFNQSSLASMEDDPLLTYIQVDQFEIRETDGANPFVTEGQGWIGYDLNKIWWKLETETVSSNTEEAELQLLYSKAVSTYFQTQIGWRRDFKQDPTEDWLVIGIQGLAPYFFETDIALFAKEDGQTALRLKFEYELLFTQKLVLVPEIEINAYGKNEESQNIGSGLANIEIGLRLNYFFNRQFAVYTGVNWSNKYHNTAKFALAQGEDKEDAQWVTGLRFWY